MVLARAYQRGRGGQRGQFAPGPSVRGAPKFGKKKFGTFFDINNGLRKNFLNLNFADIGPIKGLTNVLTRICTENFFEL